MSNLDAILLDAVRLGVVPNVAVVVSDRAELVYQGAYGPSVAGGSEPLSLAHSFRIASMTKTVTTVAALRLTEQGLLELDRPVADYLPRFGEVGVLEGQAIRRPRRPVTVRHLVTHTSGLAYWFLDQQVLDWERATGTPNVATGSLRTFEAPMVFEPGDRFEYGISTDWLGQVVEAVCGQRLGAMLRDEVFDPLGMAETGFSVPERAVVPIHVRDGDRWVPIEMPATPEFDSGGGGLYSTPLDFVRFQRMLLAGGLGNGHRILSEATVAAMFTNQIGALDFPAEMVPTDPQIGHPHRFGPGLKWGFGLQLHPAGKPGLRGPGTGGWFGVFNTYFWVDRARGVTVAAYTQTLPAFDPAISDMLEDIEKAVYAELPASHSA
jgi:methyl acetate hydrolase